MEAGVRPLGEMARELEDADFGILCVTAANQEAPWLNFEAGALSKHVAESRVTAFLTDMEPGEVKQPLGQFQHKRADLEGVKELLLSINGKSGDQAIPVANVEAAAQRWWPQLESELVKVTPDAASQVPKRGVSAMVEELLESNRSLVRRINEIEAQATSGFDPHYVARLAKYIGPDQVMILADSFLKNQNWSQANYTLRSTVHHMEKMDSEGNWPPKPTPEPPAIDPLAATG